MHYIQTRQCGKDTVVSGVRDFCLDDILDCGQCFRWERLAPGCWKGVVSGRCRTVSQKGDTLTFLDTPEEEFHSFWYDYFDLGRDYGEVKKILRTDETMCKAIDFTPGMRVLRQDPWEALCSFILSQNNNIKRIRGLVERLCENFGESIEGGFAFPTAQRLANCSVEALAPVRCGFRAKYIIDAAQKVCKKEVKLYDLYNSELEAACEALQKINGVGPKVARCALLYGFGRAECVPVDVWISRALAAFYPGGMPQEIASAAGLGQQYLFHYVRHHPQAFETEGLR